MHIKAIIINGRRGGEVINMEYAPKISVPIYDESQISLGEAEDGSVLVGEKMDYYECFRGVDKQIVLYSTGGQSSDIMSLILNPTYPIRF